MTDDRAEYTSDNTAHYPLVYSDGSPLIPVFQTLEKVLDSPTTVPIEGESGTGKDALACWLHYNSSGRDGPLVKINFAALPEDLVESELFGYERGAFTGAVQSKQGKLELAQEGTLVFDEVGSVDLGLQSKLLQVVEAKDFYRLGGNQSVHLDARIVALSSVDLARAVEEQTFRQDLFFRLNLITVRVPALRERRSEIFPIAESLVEQLERKYRKRRLRIHPDCRQLLEDYDFPGNVRELRNALERAIVTADGSRINPSDFPKGWRSEGTAGHLASLEEVEAEHIRKVLEHTRGRKQRAARILGISRKTLLEQRKKYGLD